MKKIKAYDEFGEQFELGLVPATEEEQQACGRKVQKVSARCPRALSRRAMISKGFKYYKLVKLDDRQLELKIKAENVRRLRQIDRHSVTQIILQSITLGFTALLSLCAIIACFY